jgi:hypothetical protein
MSMVNLRKWLPLSTTNELLVQIQINTGNAAAGDSGANVDSSALMSVLVTQRGAPVGDLAPLGQIGDQTGSISLPPGWILHDGFSVRPFGCSSTVTEFINYGNGLYNIRIVPSVQNPNCAWLSGQYLYAVYINITNGNVIRQGSALAKLTIP